MADKLKVVITDEQKDIKIETGVRMLLRRCCHAVLANESYKGSAKIGITFTDNERLDERSNEVQTPPVKHELLVIPNENESASDMPHLGNVFISFEKAIETAEKQNNPLKHHLALVTAYGVLQLLGYNHGETATADKADLAMYQLGLQSSSFYYINQ